MISRKQTVASIAVLTLGLSLVAYGRPMMQAVYHGQYDPATASPTTQNLIKAKTVALGVVMYAADFDEVLPYGQSTGAVIEVTKPYYKQLDVWWTTDARRFLFNPTIQGVSLTSMEDPSKLLMVYAERPYTDGKREVAFMDGHAKRLDSAGWKTAEASLHVSIERSAKTPLPAGLGAMYNTQKPPVGR